MTTFGTTTSGVPANRVTVRGGGTVSISAAFSNTYGIVGGMDTANGSATPGEVQTISSPTDATTQFGGDSELKEQIDLAFTNGAAIIYAVGVSETSVTDSFSGTGEGTLNNKPAFDPNLHDQHDITVTDTVEATDVTVNIDYSSPPATPSESNTMNLNPVTGEWDADESTDYDISYTYGDYPSAITEIVKKVPRFVTVLSENATVANDLLTELNTYATNFSFMHGVAGTLPNIDPSTYSDSFDDRRISVVSPSRAFLDTANTNMTRTMGAVGGYQASKELGNSSTKESLNGFVDLNTKYVGSEIGDLIDNQVLPLEQRGGVKVAKDMTTSTDPRFERIYASEITDEATEISNNVSEDFVGDQFTETKMKDLGESHSTSYAEMKNTNLLDDFDVTVSEGANTNEVDVDVSLDIIDLMDVVDVTLTVGDRITNGGAS